MDTTLLTRRLDTLITALHSLPAPRTDCVDLQWALEEWAINRQDGTLSEGAYRALVNCADAIISHIETRYQVELNSVEQICSLCCILDLHILDRE